MSTIIALIEFMGKLLENPTIFLLLKIFSLFSVLYRIFLQINKIILFARTNKIFSRSGIVYITYDSWKGLFKDYLILHFKILSFSSLVVWFFDNPFRLAHLILLFSLLISSFLLLLFFLISDKKLNFFEGFKLFFFFIIFLSFLSISFCYNLNLFLFIKYTVWLDVVIWISYTEYGIANMSFIDKTRVIYAEFLRHAETSKIAPHIHKNFRSHGNAKNK